MSTKKQKMFRKQKKNEIEDSVTKTKQKKIYIEKWRRKK